MRPKWPASMADLITRAASEKRDWEIVQTTSPVSSAFLTTSSASSSVRHMGFSTTTCFPASSAIRI